MSSEQIYYTYYSPTDWHHPNKVKYTENLSNAGDLLVTSSSGFENLNARDVIPTYWNGSIKMVNDYNYNISITHGFKYMPAMLGDIQYVAANSNIAHTIAKQITIDDFDYDTIFGLSKVNPNVIDYNWYKVNDNGKNIFNNKNNEGKSESNNITDKETTRIGPKLFLYKGGANDYNTGDITETLNPSSSINKVTTSEAESTYNNILSYKNQILAWNGASATIKNDTTFYNAEKAWPYKIQYNPNQWYHILTNGQKSALLTLPYYYYDSASERANNLDRYYLLNVKKDTNSNPVYSYYQIDKIVENNYYYIVSYFDTRPTVKNKTITFNSNTSSLFNENAIQIMPLTRFDYQTFIALHDNSMSSCVASCIPLSYTTSKSPDPPLTTKLVGTGAGINSYPENFGLNPIAIKYEKNLTITTTLNYTIANMTNLSNILTGWDYLHKNFTNNDNINFPLLVRGNMPYINAGIIIYIPADNNDNWRSKTDKTNNTYELNSNDCFVRFKNWLEAFNINPNNDNWFYGVNGGYTENGQVTDPVAVNSSNINFSNYFKSLYTSIASMVYSNTEEINENPTTGGKNFYTLSLPAYINFNNNAAHYGVFDDHLPNDNIYSLGENFKNTNNFLRALESNANGIEAGSVIKFVNTLCVPINNALNTTHTANDNYTFRLSKASFNNKISNTDYFYIIGTYIYITKNLPYETFKQYPHYLGFSPSTNITTHSLMTTQDYNAGDAGVYNGEFLYPQRTIQSFVCDSQNYLNVFNGSTYENKGDMLGRNYYALMKDIFVTPSLYMTINESVGDV